ncbi:MAG: transcription-repair coupling factor [Rikenellaceae bacterium]
MESKENIIGQFATSKGVVQLKKALKNSTTIHLKELVSSALSSYAAATISAVGGVHIFVEEDRDAAAYLLNDFYALLGEEHIFFLPTSFKRSIVYGKEDANGVVQRTSTLNRLRGAAAAKSSTMPYTVVCTYPEALAESVVDDAVIEREQIVVKVGESVSVELLVDMLEAMGFVKVNFVYEPGQYSSRGGIFDVFSFSESRPFRIDLFDDEVDSIRRFNISNQLSYDKVERAVILPNFNQNSVQDERRVSFAEFTGGVNYWFTDPTYALKKVNDLRHKLLAEMEEPSQIDSKVTSRNRLLADMAGSCVLTLRDNIAERSAEVEVNFATQPQPEFNKNFEMLAGDMLSFAERGYKTYFATRNLAQVERLENIFYQAGYRGLEVVSVPLPLHGGFVDNDLKIRLFTDHQIFDRYQRYKIKDEIKRDEQMTIAELNELKLGDYVVHYDHGVAKFGGLVKIDVNGTKREVIKLIYKDQDLLFVNVHSLHCIARYKSGEGEPPKIYKLGGGAWQKLKNTTKKAVKDISRELIAFYAKRKASSGFAFSADGYLQQELEASFMYEDTPDQNAASEAVKRDMESSEPMDRLVCGDVGFGKTEVAIRAAFKAATDGKQVAVLVPTTILAMQHYRSFVSRLRDFPIRIEYLNRTKSTREVNAILADLKEGKVDILIGTHKILGKGVHFRDLGLLIIDEEQKFGVAAKEKLTQISVSVDTLTLTATPIPRTLQFSLMGSRDLSVISTPPPNRQPIVTESHLFGEEIITEAITEEIERGGQVYFVHNRVDDIFAIKAMIERICPKVRVAVGHGQMPPKELEAVVMDFIYGEYDLLLATTIVENGIDVPNANTIIINNAHRFGLSALHQLRGRVGRSDRRAYCYLLSPPEEMLTSDARHRLRAIEEFSDLGSGFNIAMQDLDIRGAGNLLGAEQSGFIANIGFETYQRIMQEAITELRQEGLDVAGLSPKEQEVVEQLRYIEDSHIEVEVPASLPDAYIGSAAEKLKLYRELDSLPGEEELQGFATRLVDRFGRMPRESEELLNVVRLRREAIRLGMERVKVKNGLMIISFVGEQNSPYYKSELFLSLLKTITERPDKFVLRQNNNRLAMTVRGVKDIEEAYKLLLSF